MKVILAMYYYSLHFIHKLKQIHFFLILNHLFYKTKLMVSLYIKGHINSGKGQWHNTTKVGWNFVCLAFLFIIISYFYEIAIQLILFAYWPTIYSVAQTVLEFMKISLSHSPMLGLKVSAVKFFIKTKSFLVDIIYL